MGGDYTFTTKKFILITIYDYCGSIIVAQMYFCAVNQNNVIFSYSSYFGCGDNAALTAFNETI